MKLISLDESLQNEDKAVMIEPYRLLQISWLKFRDQTLYVNSFYLMASTATMAILGFLFWLLAARIYSSAELGIAVTLVSIMTYISTVSQLGLNIGIMRYLPHALNQKMILDSSFTIVAIISLISTSIFLLSVKMLVPSAIFLVENPLMAISFFAFMIFATLNVTLESMFIAQRKSLLVLVKNTLLSVLKVCFLFAFAGLGAYGLFSSWALAVAIVIIGGFGWLYLKRHYRLHFHISGHVVKEMASYSAGNYTANLLSNLPQYILPIMLTTYINPSTTAYYNIAMSYAILLFSVPFSVCNALFAESATEENLIKKNVYRTIKLIVVILIPAIAIIFLFGDWGLNLFGAEYAENSYGLLLILSISSIFVTINTICWTILNLNHNIREIVFTVTMQAVMVITLSRILIDNGLIGIGIAWLVGQAFTSIIYIIVIYKLRMTIGLK